MKQMPFWKTFLVVIASLLALITTPVVAGSNNNKNPDIDPEELTQFAKKVEKVAASEGARAFIIARQGRVAEELPDGISFTHTAIAVYSNITLDTGDIVRGYAIYNLYQDADDPGLSHLIQDYPVDFYAGAAELKAGVLIPHPKIQLALVDLVHSGQYKALHNPAYSVLANPFNSQRQNCTEYTLDLVNAAIYGTTDRARLKANTSQWFTPQPVKISRFKLSLGGLFNAGVTSRDHKGQIRTATFTSIARYLEENALLRAALLVQDDLSVTAFKQHQRS